MKILFTLDKSQYEKYDYVLTWRGGSRLWLPDHAPELTLLKPDLAFEVAEALRLGDTCLERLAAVSPRRWQWLYATAAFVDYELPKAEGATYMMYMDLDLAVISARRLSNDFRVLLEAPQLSITQASLLTGTEVDVLISSQRGVEAADAVARQARAAARAALRALGLLGGAWDRSTLPSLNEESPELAVFKPYEAPGELEPPRPRKLKELLAWAFLPRDRELMRDAAALLAEIAASPLPLKSIPDLSEYRDVLRSLLLYGFIAVERDVVRATEKGLFAALQMGVKLGEEA